MEKKRTRKNNIVASFCRFGMVIIFLIFGLLSFCQKEANMWYFGNKAALDFNSGAPVPLSNNVMNTWEGVASIADPISGRLLFYTDGMTIWDSTHTAMPNGSGLLGDSSSSQAALIIPHPGMGQLYYLFTVDGYGGSDGLRYSMINMNLNGGNGDVAVGYKNVLLQSPVSEKITAARHANGTDIWIISHLWNSNQFVSYRISAVKLIALSTKLAPTPTTSGFSIRAR